MNNETSRSDNPNVNDNEKPKSMDNEQTKPPADYIAIDLSTYGNETILINNDGVITTAIKSDSLPLTESQHPSIHQFEQIVIPTMQAQLIQPEPVQLQLSGTSQPHTYPPQQGYPHPPRENTYQSSYGQENRSRYQRQPEQEYGVSQKPAYPYPRYPSEESVGPLGFRPSRNNFVARVMMVATIMLFVTASLIIITLRSRDIKRFVFANRKIFLLVALGGMIIVNIGYCLSASRKSPCNFILAVLMVVFMTITALVVTVMFKTTATVYATLATASITLVCFALALTKFDFTSRMIYIVVITTGISVVGVIVLLGSMLLGVYTKPLHIVILVLFVIAQAVVLVLELQMILGSKSVEFSEDEWLIAAVLIYSSIINIFIQLVQILGLCDFL